MADLEEEELASTLIADHVIARQFHIESQTNSRRTGEELTSLLSNSISSTKPPYTQVQESGYEERQDSISDSSESSDEAIEITNSPLWSQFTSKPSTPVICIVLFLVVIAQTTAAVPTLDLVVNLICKYHFADQTHLDGPTHDGISFITDPDPRCHTAEVQKLVSSFQTLTSLIYSSLSIIITPKLAALSDRIGRRPVLIYCGTFLILGNCVFLIGSLNPQKFSYRSLLLAYVFEGLAGSMMLSYTTCLSYISDYIKPETRANSVALLDAILFAATGFGPVLGSLVLTHFQSLSALYTTVIGILVLYLLTVIFLCPESRSKLARRQSVSAFKQQNDVRNSSGNRWTRFFSAINIFEPLRALKFKHLPDRQSRINARLIIAAPAIIVGVAIGLFPVLFLYAELKFSWTAIETGYLLSVLGVSRAFTLVVVVPVLAAIIRRYTKPNAKSVDAGDQFVIRVAVIGTGISYLLLAGAQNGTTFMLCLVLSGIGVIETPILKNCLIKYAEPSAIGELLGVLSMLISLATLVSPVLLFWIYRHTVSTHPETVLFVPVIGYVIVLVITFFMKETHKIPDAMDEEDIAPEGE